MLIHCVAWENEFGAGFDWYFTPEESLQAYIEEQKTAKGTWKIWRFDFVSGINATKNTLTMEQEQIVADEVEPQLTELCALATEHCNT